MNEAWHPKTEYLLYLSSLSQRNQSCALIILAGSFGPFKVPSQGLLRCIKGSTTTEQTLPARNYSGT